MSAARAAASVAQAVIHGIGPAGAAWRRRLLASAWLRACPPVPGGGLLPACIALDPAERGAATGAVALAARLHGEEGRWVAATLARSDAAAASALAAAGACVFTPGPGVAAAWVHHLPLQMLLAPLSLVGVDFEDYAACCAPGSIGVLHHVSADVHLLRHWLAGTGGPVDGWVLHLPRRENRHGDLTLLDELAGSCAAALGANGLFDTAPPFSRPHTGADLLLVLHRASKQLMMPRKVQHQILAEMANGT